MIKSISPWLQSVFWLALSAGLLYLALRDFTLADIGQALQQADWGMMLLALGSVALNTLAKAARWQQMLAGSQRQVGFGTTLLALLGGQTLNWFLPGRVGDISRLTLGGRGGPGGSFVLGTLALEKVLDMLAYALLFLGALLLLPLPGWLVQPGYALLLVTGLLLAGLLLLVWFPGWFIDVAARLAGWLPHAWRGPLLVRLQRGLDSLAIIRNRAGLLGLVGWTVLVWLTAGLNNILVGRALGLSLPATAALLVVLALHAGIALPGAPGRIGLFQYLCIITLGLFGVDQAHGLSFGLLLQAVVMLPGTLVSLVAWAAFGVVPGRQPGKDLG